MASQRPTTGRRGRPPHPDILTPAEWRVLDLLREGLSNPEIAERLALSRDTVKTHVAAILAKLRVATREEAAAWEPAPEAAREPQLRRWGFGLAGWLRPVTLGKAALVGASVVVLAGMGVLAWGVLRTSGDKGDERQGAVTSTTEGVMPFVPATDVWVIDADGSDLKRLTNLGQRALSGYEIAPAWSPDGTRIAFFSRSGSDIEVGYLYVMQADGTNLTQLAPASFDYTRKSWCESDRSAVWSPDGTRVAYQANNQIHVIDPATGETAANFPFYSFDPAWSGDSTAVAYSTGAFDCWIGEYSLQGDSPRLTTIMGQDVAWSPDGKHLAYVDSGRIMVADPDGQNGMQVAEVNLRGDPLEPFNLQWSPDGTRLSYIFVEPDTSRSDMWVYVVDLASRGTPARLVSPGSRTYDWSPDGRQIAYEVQEDDSCHYPIAIYVANTDGTGTPQKAVRGAAPSWSPDGERIAFVQTTLPQECPTPIIRP